ncbi:MAG: regulatory protein RecX [bacterium]|nr:regulatory protein RecX [bacterium]
MSSNTNDPHYQAQKILSRRDYTEFEMRAKLKQKKITAAQIDDTINWLKDNQLINDADFAASYIASVLNYKSVGPYWLKAKLKQKGIAGDIIESAIGQVFTDEHEVKIATEAASRWQRLHSNAKNDKQKLYRFLASRGFSSDCITRVTDKLF